MVYDYRETIIDENLCSGLIEKPSGYMYMRFDNQDQMRMLAKDETRSLSLSLCLSLSCPSLNFYWLWTVSFSEMKR